MRNRLENVRLENVRSNLSQYNATHGLVQPMFISQNLDNLYYVPLHADWTINPKR